MILLIAGLLVLPFVGIVLVTLFDFSFRPMFRRLAFRNMTRRKSEALLVVLGSLLGTAIITSSFIVGDTFDASIRDLARTQLGPIDEIVSVDRQQELDEIERRFTAEPVKGTDPGLLRITSATGTVATLAGDGGARKAEPRALVNEVDFGQAREFGGNPAITGFDGTAQTPGPGETVINTDLARELGVGPGNQIELHLYGSARTLTIKATVPALGVAGFTLGGGSRALNLFVTPGTLRDWFATAPPIAQSAGPVGRIALSNPGSVFDSTRGSNAIIEEVERRLDDLPGWRVDPIKADLLEAAELQGQSLSALFTTIGGFSVIAGILLLVNIFVMLAEERKTELGMLRAGGFKRNHLVRVFGLEGNLYAAVAAVLGALAGIGVGRIIVWVTGTIINNAEDQATFDLRFAVDNASLAIGMGAGGAISMVTVWGTSLRIARLNVIRAIRDLPEPVRTRHRLRRLVFASLGVIGGGLIAAAGISNDAAIPTLIGPAISLFCAVPLLSWIMPRRLAVSLPCLLAVGWGVFSFNLLADIFQDTDITVFVFQGLVLVGGAVALVVTNADKFHVIVDALSGSRRGLAARLGLANPLARRGRTGLLLGMYSIVLFVLTFLVTLTGIFSAQAPQFTDAIRAGYDVYVESNPANPLTANDVMTEPGVAGAVDLWRGFTKFTAPGRGKPEDWSVSGFTEGLLTRGSIKLSSRSSDYGSDVDAWRALLTSPNVAIIPSFFLTDGSGPATGRLEPGDKFTGLHPSNGNKVEMTIIGVVDSDFTDNGVWIGAQFMPQIADRFYRNRQFVAAAPGTDPDVLAQKLTAKFLANGTDADSFRGLVDKAVAEQRGFFQLMEGFLALGLVIGIAGLGVVMVRAVRERRRQIGMLRALGFSSRTVRGAFLIEATFITLQGIAIGVGLGLLTSWSLLTNSETFGDERLPFTVPWSGLGLIVAVSLGASLLAVYGPAAQAARIKPAVALRIAD